jgi:hypothetical protein
MRAQPLELGKSRALCRDPLLGSSTLTDKHFEIDGCSAWETLMSGTAEVFSCVAVCLCLFAYGNLLTREVVIGIKTRLLLTL